MQYMVKPLPFPSLAGLPDTPDFTAKLCAGADLAERLTSLPRPLVFTNGVFDVLHRGHVMYLAQARALGASLVVALNTDASARRLGKGPDRPLNNEMDRACVLAALASSSLVTWFDEDTPQELIALVRPDMLVKGGDYDMAKLPETALVESWGGRALALPFVAGYSTTALVSKIRSHKKSSPGP
jgi:rfaE bifunctional protein nucleotidyltransferase chain/domain